MLGRKLVVTLTVAASVACGGDRGRPVPDVWFALEEGAVPVDTPDVTDVEESARRSPWSPGTGPVIRARGPDSADTYLVVAMTEQRAVAEAGGKTDTVYTTTVVRDGKGRLTSDRLGSPGCGRPEAAGRPEGWRHPEASFRLVGFTRLRSRAPDTTPLEPAWPLPNLQPTTRSRIQGDWREIPRILDVLKRGLRQ